MLIPNSLDTNGVYTLLNEDDLRQMAEEGPKAHPMNGHTRYSDVALEDLLRQKVRDIAGSYYGDRSDPLNQPILPATAHRGLVLGRKARVHYGRCVPYTQHLGCSGAEH